MWYNISRIKFWEEYIMRKNNSKTSVWRILGASLLAVFMIACFVASVFPDKQKRTQRQAGPSYAQNI